MCASAMTHGWGGATRSCRISVCADMGLNDERVAGTEALRVGAFYRVKLAKWPSCNIYWVTAPNPIMVARSEELTENADKCPRRRHGATRKARAE